MSGVISNVTIEGDVIDALVEHLDATLEGVPEGPKIIALIASALAAQKPDLTPEQAIEGVKETTQFMVMWLSGVDDEKLTPEQKNLKVN